MATQEQMLLKQINRVHIRGGSQTSTNKSPSKSKSSTKDMPSITSQVAQTHDAVETTKSGTTTQPQKTTTTTDSGGVGSTVVTNDDEGVEFTLNIRFDAGFAAECA